MKKELKSIVNQQKKEMYRTIHNDNSIITIRIADTNKSFKLRYHNFDYMQELLDEIWRKLNSKYRIDLPAYTYGKTWMLMNTNLDIKIDKEFDINRGSDFRTLDEALIAENDTLEVHIF